MIDFRSTVPRTVEKIDGRGERIRTSGPCLPKTVLYQAELLPDRSPPDASRVRSQGARPPSGRVRRCASGGSQRPSTFSQSSTRTNFSRGLPGRARPTSAASILRQSSKSVGIDAALGEQALEPFAAGLPSSDAGAASPPRPARPLHSRRGGWCRSSRSARAAPSRPRRAGRRSCRCSLSEFPAALVVGNAVDRRGLNSRCADDQRWPAPHRSRPVPRAAPFSSSSVRSTMIRSALPSPSIAQRLGEKVEDHALRLGLVRRRRRRIRAGW